MTDHTASDDPSDSGPPGTGAEIYYDVGDGERQSEAVVRAVASLTDTPVLDLEPLYDVVDPDHLDGMFADREHNGAGDHSLSFDYHGCHVTVSPDSVHVRANGENPV